MSHRLQDSYRPASDRSQGERSQSRGQADQRSLIYHFGGQRLPDRDDRDRYRDNYRDRDDYRDDRRDRRDRSPRARSPDHRPFRDDFSFRHEPPPDVARHLRYSSDLFDRRQNRDHYEPPMNGIVNDRHHKSGRQRRSRSPQRLGRGRFRPTNLAHERPLLATTRDKTPEQLDGMLADSKGASKFLKVDDVSDSAEEDMDMDSSASDDLASKDTAETAVTGHDRDVSDKIFSKGSTLPATAGSPKTGTAPRWSNPDPYTSLPPPDESRVKKRDVVRLIRKARIATVKKTTSDDVKAISTDFISLDFGDSNTNGGIAKDTEQSEHEIKQTKILTDKDRNGTLPMKLGVMPAPLLPHSSYRDPDLLTASNVALGKRKRGDDPDLSPPPMAKRGKKPASDGSVSAEWLPRNGQSPTPWCKYDHSVTENVGFWLHKEICDFYDYAKPKVYDGDVRKDLLDRLEKVSQLRHPTATIYCFGSFGAELHLPNADMDVVLISQEYRNGGYRAYGTSNNWYHKFSRFLEGEDICEHGSMQVITHAKVPIIKFTDKITGIKVDLSVENWTGPDAVLTIRSWTDTYTAMPILVTLIKQFLAMRELNEVSSGGLGGFSITCLVTSLLQHMPQVSSKNMKPEQHLGDVLMEFLDLYGNRFDRVRTGIQMNPPAYFDKFSNPRLDFRKNAGRLTIEDPNNASNDISGGTHNIDVICRSFSQAYTDLQSKMRQLHQAPLQERKEQSILGIILGGNYSSFDRHRQRARQLWEDMRHDLV